jgi:hypothetical protein
MKVSYSKNLLSKIIFVLLLFLYRISLDLCYIYIISPNYSYAGLFIDMNYYKIIESFIILFVCGLTIKHKIEKPSDFFILFIFSMLVIPLLSIYSLQDKSREFLYMVIISIYVIKIVSKVPQIKLPLLKHGDKIALIISIVTGIVLFGWIIVNGGFSYLNFNLANVYDFRGTVSEMIFPGKLSYAKTSFGKILNPVLIAYYLWKRNKKMIITTIAVQVLFFGITAHKAMLFYPLLIVFAFLFGEKKYFGQMIPFGLFGVTFLSSIYYSITNNIILASLFVRRVLFVTVDNHYRYYDTFKKLGFLYFSNRSWFPKIIEYPLNYPVPQVISKIYYGHINTWVNTGFLATGYINFGFVGMLVYAIIVGLIFRYIDYLAKNCLPLWFCIAIMIVPIFSLLSADLPTALLTHGILLAMLMLWLISSSVLENDKL